MRQACFLVLLTIWNQAYAQSTSEFIDSITPDIIEIRHQIHSNPELSNREFETAKLIADFLTNLEIEVRTGIAHTGVVGIIRGSKPGPVVAIRADIDALPVTEATGYLFASTKRTEFEGQEVGIAHACGHDIHTAVQMGVARTLISQKDTLAGTVMLIFQPAEEGAPTGEDGGASLMVQEGVFADLRPQAIFAFHAFPSIPVGQVGFTSGPSYASSDRFHIAIIGRQSHGAWPHLGVDPIVMAAQAITSLQNIRARNLDPREPAVISVGSIKGGQRFNIIPEQVELTGTVRTYNSAIQDFVEQRMGEILEGITKSNGGTYTLNYQRLNPPTVNPAELAAWARGSLENTLGPTNVIPSEPVMGAEDFAYFAQEVPGFYFRLGVNKLGTETGGLHTPTMRADDSSIGVGIKAMTGLVLDFLEDNKTVQTPPPETTPEATPETD